MTLLDFYKKQIKKLTIWDVGLIKLVTFLVGMIAGAFAMAFVLANMTYFIVAIVVFGAVVFSRFYFR